MRPRPSAPSAKSTAASWSRRPALKQWLATLKNNNAQGEYYLTDIVAQAVADGVPVVSAQPSAEWEVAGVNSKVQLAELERRHQLNIATSCWNKA
jgi:bifunctional UDP-N-acetylglucosamine pyrophosphorylase/glucosamine-1-phosphate N-acetyltransferase